MAEQKRRKKKRGLKKKQFILLIVGICVIALVTEVVLLIHTFSEKEEEKPTPTPAVAEVTPTKEPTDKPVEYKTVWRVTKEEASGNNSFSIGHDYDEQGREVRRVEYKPDGVTPESTTILKYDRSGIILAQSWKPDTEGELVQTKCYFPTAADFDTLDYWTVIKNLTNTGEIVTKAEYDSDGNLEGLDSTFSTTGSIADEGHSHWSMDEKGRVSFHGFMEPGEEEYHRWYEFEYDDEDRLISVKYRDDYGEKTQMYAIHYRDNHRTVVQKANGYWIFDFKDEKFVRLSVEYTNEAWGRLVRRENPDYSIQDGWVTQYHYPNMRYPNMDHTPLNMSSPYYTICATDEYEYKGRQVTRQTVKTLLDEDSNPIREIRSFDGSGDVRESNTECTKTFFEYETVFRDVKTATGQSSVISEMRLLRSYEVGQKDVLSQRRYYTVDDNKNLREFVDGGTTYRYQWISVEIQK